MTRIDRRTAIGVVAGAAGAGLVPGTALGAPRSGGMVAQHLRCEWLTEPRGIDTLTPRFCWEVSAASEPRGAVPHSARILVSRTEAALAARRGDVWDSGALENGTPWAQPPNPLELRTHDRYYWSVGLTGPDGRTRWSAPASFGTGVLTAGEWRGEWIAAGPEFPPRPPHTRGNDKGPPDDPAQNILPLLRRRFALDRQPVRATVSLAGLGHGALTVNGRPATTALLEPGWTEYRRTILYSSYDVTSLLAKGENVLGVMLGNGMFNVERKADRKSKFVDSFGRPKLMLMLSLDFADGSRQQIVSDASWEVAEGPILFSSIFGGEDIDARRVRTGWDMPGDASPGWRPATIAKGPGGDLKSQGIPPVIVHQRFETVKITEPKPGVFVYDLGTNFAGRPVLKVRGAAGAKVRLIPAEVLGEDGLFWQRSFNAGPGRMVEYNYTLAGDGEEVFKPQFTYHGFRYVQVEGAAPAKLRRPDLPRITAIEGEFMYADLPLAGTFDCSNPLFVDTHKLIERAVLSNAYSVLTDCPHREKLGWLEQTHLNAATISYNRDAVTLYEKMVRDIADTQKPDGMVPGIAPEYIAFEEPDGSDHPARNSPEWGAAVVLSPWATYRTYGDTRILSDAYPAMRRYLDYLASRARDGIIEFGLGDWYDVGPDKLGPSQLTSLGLTGTATWYQALLSAAAIARVMGRPPEEAADFEKRAAIVLAAFNAKYFHPETGRYDRGSQTANAMPLALGMVPAGREDAVLAALIRAIRESENGVTAGDIGFHYVVRALTEHGRDDVMFDMMSVTDRPSYGYQLAQGATALTESWSADPTKSLNHFMLGHGEGWLFGALAGIRVDFAAEAARILTIAPRPVGNVAHASAELRTVLGTVRSAWRRRDALIELAVTVPAGAQATVLLPTTNAGQVMEGGRKAAAAPGVRAVRPVPAGLEMTVASGDYRFAAPLRS